MEWFLAALIAGLLTIFDLDRTFYVPKAASERASLWLLWYGFAAGNALLAVGVHASIRHLKPFSAWYPPLRGVIVGLSVLAILRLKLTTFSLEGHDVPFGFELFYESAKGFVYQRINDIAKRARREEALSLVQSRSVQELTILARLNADHDALLTTNARSKHKDWILQVRANSTLTDGEKRIELANYILLGKAPDS